MREYRVSGRDEKQVFGHQRYNFLEEFLIADNILCGFVALNINKGKPV